MLTPRGSQPTGSLLLGRGWGGGWGSKKAGQRGLLEHLDFLRSARIFLQKHLRGELLDAQLRALRQTKGAWRRPKRRSERCQTEGRPWDSG